MNHSDLEALLEVEGRDCCVACCKPTWTSGVLGPSPSPCWVPTDARIPTNGRRRAA